MSALFSNADLFQYLDFFSIFVDLDTCFDHAVISTSW